MDCRRIPSGLSGYGNMVVIARDFWRGPAEASAAGLPNHDATLKSERLDLSLQATQTI